MIRLAIVIAVWIWLGTIPALIAALWVCCLWGISAEALHNSPSLRSPEDG